MPFVLLKTNVTVSDQQATALKQQLGQAIALIPNVSEQSLLFGIEDTHRFYLKGKEQAVAYVEISVFNNPQHQGYAKLTSVISQFIGQILDIPNHHIYLKYKDISAWGVGGYYFE